jgi:hypothetical protein
MCEDCKWEEVRLGSVSRRYGRESITEVTNMDVVKKDSRTGDQLSARQILMSQGRTRA